MKMLMTLATSSALIATLSAVNASADEGDQLAPQKARVCKQLAAFDKAYTVGGNFKQDLNTWCHTKVVAGPESSEMDLVSAVSDDLYADNIDNLPPGPAGDRETNEMANVSEALSQYANAFISLP